ncbi:MAG: bifunctional 4-hydroxy-2-oxoglutarate aldolase/2-dehydro-3-deoxy-phosphogluconate aldolase [Bacillota bacterium]|nr:bifunctional 4-hydroxy-2-oxoglutarate aldolase/2-dehydro-3-deoxy-phosphogluconate aldolase [Bacillota bacterium]
MRSKTETIVRLERCGLVPVIRVSSAQDALDTAEALREGGVDVIEVTMSVPGALNAIETLHNRFGDEVVLGAGTVLDTETARLAILAGAEVLVSPNLTLDVVELCHGYGVVAMPGALTPTEIMQAWEAGADLVKVFPAGLVGGPRYIKAVKEPLPQVALVALGGVNLETTPEYIKAGATAVGVGAALVDKAAIAEKRFGVITEKARQFRAAVEQARNQKG